MVWYPGKSLVEKVKEKHQERRERKADEQSQTGAECEATTLQESPDPQADNTTTPLDNQAKTAPSFRPLRSLRNKWKSKRELQVAHRGSECDIGTVRVRLLEGQDLIAKQPYLVAALDGNEARTSTAQKGDEAVWGTV